LLSVTELRGSNLSISVHDLKYIDASANLGNMEQGESFNQLMIKDENDASNKQL